MDKTEIGHDQYKRITKITLSMKTVSNVFVGSGISRLHGGEELLKLNLFDMDPSLLMRHVEKSSKIMGLEMPLVYLNERYVIPGSTIKGLSRSRMELYGTEPHCYSVLDMRGNKPFLDRKAKTYHELFGITRDYPEFKKMDGTCWICNIYGAVAFGRRDPKSRTSFIAKKGKVSFSDAVFDVSVKNNPKPKPFLLKSFGNKELLGYQPETTFKLTLTMMNLSKQEEAEVLQSLGALNGDTRLLGYSKFTTQLDELKEELVFGVVRFHVTKIDHYVPIRFGVLNRSKRANKPLKEELEEYKKLDLRVETQDEDLMLQRKSGNRSKSRGRSKYY